MSFFVLIASGFFESLRSFPSRWCLHVGKQNKTTPNSLVPNKSTKQAHQAGDLGQAGGGKAVKGGSPSLLPEASAPSKRMALPFPWSLLSQLLPRFTRSRGPALPSLLKPGMSQSILLSGFVPVFGMCARVSKLCSVVAETQNYSNLR